MAWAYAKKYLVFHKSMHRMRKFFYYILWLNVLNSKRSIMLNAIAIKMENNTCPFRHTSENFQLLRNLLQDYMIITLQWRHNGAMASQITRSSIVCTTVCSDTDQRKHQSSASLAFVRGIRRWPMNSLHKVPVTRKMFPFDDVIMTIEKP